MNTLIVICGPTASGKTKAAIEVAKAFDAEIISADSRQFYREIPIGTAAPNKDELSEIKHHFVGFLSVEDTYNVSDYESDVIEFLNEYFKRKKTAVMVGGSGLFIDAVCNGLDEMPDVDASVREKVTRLFDEGGIVKLQTELARLDPDFFAVVDKNNPRRLQRALEVSLQTGLPYSSFRTEKKVHRDFNIVKLAIRCERNILIDRINKRVDEMMKNGLLDEAKAMYPKRHLNSLNTVGYKELFEYFDGKISLEEAVEKIKTSTRQYAKRQMTWLRKKTDCQWFELVNLTSVIQCLKDKLA
ncbi:MAG: tRNA (adenosine(37)-N6)-dimethylallyltransferase MiaA [Bacteroidales bacterium]|nr:tRNA (adenosine(37)-N6)-dimethylallyltransferase MiaA [Bacteroidales bacterium]